PPHESTLFPYTTLFRSFASGVLGLTVIENFGEDPVTFDDVQLLVPPDCLPFTLGAEFSEEEITESITAIAVGFDTTGTVARLPSDRKSTRLNSSHVKIS